MPDKAVSVLDTACARLALGQNSIPPQLEAAQRELDDLNVQDRVLKREAATGADHEERLSQIAEKKAAVEKQLGELKERFQKELDLVNRIREIRVKLEGEPAPAAATAAASDGAAAASAAGASAAAAAPAEAQAPPERGGAAGRP